MPRTADTTVQAADALMRSLRFAGAEVRDGELPSSTDTVTLGIAAQLESLEPGGASLLPIEIDNPVAADNPEQFVLLQFEERTDHLAVPAESTGDGPGDLNLEFSLDDDVCSELCAKRFELGMLCAVELDDGEVSGRWTVDLVLDCTERGDPKLCGDGPPDDEDPGTDAGDTQAPDAGGAGIGGGADGGMQAPLDAGMGIILPPFDDAGVILPPQDYLCADGSEEPLAIACDGVADCADRSDELVCDGFYCMDTSTMIELDRVCDGVMDCPDGWDESIACVPCADNDGMFSSFQLCDGEPQCADGTDEQPMLCDPMYPCSDSSGMIPIDQFCDGVEQCPDGSDEPEGACP